MKKCSLIPLMNTEKLVDSVLDLKSIYKALAVLH